MRTQICFVALSLILAISSAEAENKVSPKMMLLPVPASMKATIEASTSKSELTSLIHQRKWQEVIAICEKEFDQTFDQVQILDGSEPVKKPVVLNEWSWRATLGELYLFNLQSKAAIDQFSFVRRYAPKGQSEGKFFFTSSKDAENFSARLRAGQGLSRAYAELNQWTQALNWHEQSLKEELKTQWCGNCAEGERVEAYSRSEVWKTALKPAVLSRPALQQIANGRFKPMKVGLERQSLANSYQKQRAAQQAALILGEIYLRQGKSKDARQMFQKTCKNSNQSYEAYLAATYLDRMNATK